MPKLKKKKCLYCDNITDDSPHFESDCCGRGMCEECYQNDIGTMEQIQLDYFEDEHDEIKPKFKDAQYLCFECQKIWSNKITK